MMSNGYIGYLPVPIWNGNRWVGYNVSKINLTTPTGYEPLDWPEGFDPSIYPIPKYNIGENIRFTWWKSIGNGNIKKIQLSGAGGAYTQSDIYGISILDLANKRAARSEVYYEVYWNGHGRDVREINVL